MSKPFYITTPIYYVNDRPHIGHAYTSLACDVIARFKRLDGFDVHFLTGTDEHGQKVEKSAAAAGVAPKAFVDGVAPHFQEMGRLMNISHDDNIRTTEPRHIYAAQALWRRMAERGFITLGKYAGWYCVRDEAYYQESELVNGKAPTGADVEWVEEPSYFFTLSAFTEKLLAYYEAHPEFIAPNSRRNEIISFVKGGLKDLSISRTTFSWGIPVPGDDKHIMYVWLDALANYLSALGFPDDTTQMQRLWPADLHMVGKDILRFHTVYWPAFLMAADLPLPKRIFGHGWWTVEGEKMSKSLGNVVAPQELVDQFGLDQTRWFLLREVPFGNDGNFAREAMKMRINSELANNIGNLVQRTLSMVHKHCEGKIPAYEDSTFEPEAIDLLYNNFDTHRNHINNQQLHLELEEIITISNYANGFIDRMAPWALKKTDPNKMEHVLSALVDMIRIIAIISQPFIPESASKILDTLNISSNNRSFLEIDKARRLPTGHAINPPAPIFPRVE